MSVIVTYCQGHTAGLVARDGAVLGARLVRPLREAVEDVRED
jgi:hypothetical protein